MDSGIAVVDREAWGRIGERLAKVMGPEEFGTFFDDLVRFTEVHEEQAAVSQRIKAIPRRVRDISA